MKIVPFIFNWPGQFERACISETALGELFDRVLVINSDEGNTRPGWIDVGNEAYFSAQFLRAVDEFDGDVLFHLQADATYHDWPEVFRRAREAFERCHWGVFAPYVDWTAWKPPGADIVTPFAEDPDLRVVACTDCTCWMIHRDIIEEFKLQDRHFRETRFGWGIDIMVSAIAYAMERPVIRDYRHTIDHPKGRGYDTASARVEFQQYLTSASPSIAELSRHIRHDRKQLHGRLQWLEKLQTSVKP